MEEPCVLLSQAYVCVQCVLASLCDRSPPSQLAVIGIKQELREDADIHLPLALM
jgi:hypothetical protein